jgi:5-methylcytosine-specific restriction enzyme subunit McrC
MTHRTVHEWGRVAVGDDGFTRSQADALLAAARAHPFGGADGTDILCDHHRHLRARQMVGVVAARGASLEILPKVDPAAPDDDAATVRGRLMHMLNVALGLNISTGEVAAMAHRSESLLELFITLFADRLLAEVRRGLPRQYQRFDEDLRALRGRLDPIRQFTVHAVCPDRLACRFDALAVDTPLMQIMKAGVLFAARYARSMATQRKLAELRFLLDNVRTIRPETLPWKQVRIDRTNQRWRSLLELARLLLGRRWQQTHAASHEPEGTSLLFAMNDLFEAYVAAQLRRALADSGLDIVTQGRLRYCLGPWREEHDTVGSSFATRPDIMVRSGDDVKIIIDTKWKNLSKGVSQADVYQMMAYARLYRCPRLILLYPAVPGADRRELEIHGLSGGRERLEIATLAVEEGDAELREKLRVLTFPRARSN